MIAMHDSQTDLPRYYGKYAGLVTDSGPPDGHEHRGQIKVQVPGILEEAPRAESSRPIEVLATPAFLPGMFFIPEKGAQVWVEFVAGDINFPIWTGVWYPDGETPHTASGGAPTEHHKVIRTRSSQVITFDDTEGSEQTVVKDDKHGNTITLDQHGVTVEASSSGSLTLKLGQSTVVIKGDSIEIAQGPTRKIALTAEGVAISDSLGSSVQGAVLAPIIDWLISHTHVGNMGAPTPVFPSDLAVLTSLKPTLISKGS